MRQKGTSQEPTQRMLKVGETIRHSLSLILHRYDFHDEVLAKTIVNISEVRMSPDLKHARIYVLPLQGQNSKEVVKTLNEHAAPLRKILAKELTLKFMPALRFVEDEAFFETDKIEALLHSPHVKQDLEPRE